jgi:hypothetical protein
VSSAAVAASCKVGKVCGLGLGTVHGLKWENRPARHLPHPCRFETSACNKMRVRNCAYLTTASARRGPTTGVARVMFRTQRALCAAGLGIFLQLGHTLKVATGNKAKPLEF